MKIIKLSAYLQNNVGDDLMVELLVERYPNVRFWGCRGLQKKTRKLQSTSYFDSEDVYARWGRWNRLVNTLLPARKNLVYGKVFQQLERHCICAVSIGGSVYRQIANQTLENRMTLEEKKKAPGVPFYVIGANFGPFSTQEFYNSFRDYFSNCTGVSFRDRKSFELFRDLPSVQYAPDVVFNIPQGTVKDDQKHVVISVINLADRPHLSRYASSYRNTIAKICDYFVKLEKTPVLMSFCAEEGDEECINEIYSTLSDSNRNKVMRYFYHGNTEEVLNLFRNAHFVVATRFHAMVIAMRLGKPLFSISYELKMDNILEETRSSAYCCIGHIAELVPERIYEQGQHVVNVDYYIRNAEKQFAQLDRLLQKRPFNE